MKHILCPDIRKTVHDTLHEADPQGEQDMAQLLGVRQRLAKLRGYNTWREYAQREALLPTPQHVYSFLDAAWQQLQPGVVADLNVLAAEKERLSLGPPVLEPWDMPLLLHRCREKCNKEGDVTEYLSYSTLREGVQLICSKLLGIDFTAEEPAAGEVWHESVQKYTLREEGVVLGVMYLDPFMRPGKTVQSAQFTLQGSKTLEGDMRQVPSTTLVYSLPVGAPGLPVSYAVTFMHEIGHALHSLLSETSFQHLSGTRGTVDFVEFPSHLFEHFVLDPSCLALYAKHSKTSKPLPIELQQAYRQGHAKFASFEAAQQLMYAVVDQAFYECIPYVPGRTSEAGSSQFNCTWHKQSIGMTGHLLVARLGPPSHLF